MKENKVNIAKESFKENMSFSQKKDGLTQEVRARQIENGFLITVSKYGNNSKGEWISEDKEYFSKTNILKDIQTEIPKYSIFEQTRDKLNEMK
jgi:hypothetical protein